MIVRLIISALAVAITAWTLDGVQVTPWWAAAIVAVVLGLVNALIRPIVKLISLPVNILTLVLFTFVINAAMVLLCSWLVGEEHFRIDGFGWALAFSFVMTIISWFLNLVFKK